jgi:ABC-type transport system substrate-binding protein
MLKSFVKNSPTFRAALGGLMALTVFSSCTKKEAEDGLTVYTIAHRDDMKTLDPANAYDSISLDVVPNIYASLYQYHYETRDTFRYEPLLAADMPMYSADRLTVRIPLRKGVRFQDDPCFPGGKGRELKAQDVVFGMKRLAIPSLESHGWWILEKKFVGIDDYREKLLKDPPAKEKGAIPASFDAEVEGIKVIDDYTIELKLIRPYPQLLAILSMAFTAPVPREAILAYADEKGNLQDHPVGTGQFMLEKWERGQQVILKKNPNGMSEFYPSAPQGKPNSEDVGKPLPLG